MAFPRPGFEAQSALSESRVEGAQGDVPLLVESRFGGRIGLIPSFVAAAGRFDAGRSDWRLWLQCAPRCDATERRPRGAETTDTITNRHQS